MFEYNGVQYDFCFTEERIEAIEESLDKSIMSLFVINKGALKLREVRFAFCYGLKVVGGDFVPFSEASAVYAAVKDQFGYIGIIDIIAVAVERDCPFLFRAN